MRQQMSQVAWTRAVWRTPSTCSRLGQWGKARRWSGDGLWVKASGVLRKEGGVRGSRL